MSGCYVWRGIHQGTAYTYQSCATNPGWIAAGSFGYFQPAENGVALYPGWASDATSITRVVGEAARQAAIAGSNFYGGSCDGCLDPSVVDKYDCINGDCIVSSKYSTPGFYSTLDDCKLNCGGGCSGKCISDADWIQIEGLANQVKSKICS